MCLNKVCGCRHLLPVSPCLRLWNPGGGGARGEGSCCTCLCRSNRNLYSVKVKPLHPLLDFSSQVYFSPKSQCRSSEELLHPPCAPSSNLLSSSLVQPQCPVPLLLTDVSDTEVESRSASSLQHVLLSFKTETTQLQRLSGRREIT